MEDADPLECECPQGGVSRRALGPVALVERAGPEGARDRLGSPFDEGLAEELGAGVAPMNDARVAAALGHRSDARISLQCSGVREALSAFAKRGKETWGKDGSGAGQRVE